MIYTYDPFWEQRIADTMKARIAALQARQRGEGKRVWPTTLRFVWARKFGEIKVKKHYHSGAVAEPQYVVRAGGLQRP